MTYKLIVPTLLLLILLLTGCNVVTGSGAVLEEMREVSGFDHIVLATSGELTVTQDGSEALTITAHENLLPLIRTEVRHGTLYIEARENMHIQSKTPIRFTLSIVAIKGMEVVSSGTVRAASLEAEDLRLSASGSGELFIDELSADTVKVSVSGSADLALAGNVVEQEVEVTGSGSYEAGKLASKHAVVEVSGSGDATMWITETLALDVSGSGDASYYGDPTVILSGRAVDDVNRLGDR